MKKWSDTQIRHAKIEIDRCFRVIECTRDAKEKAARAQKSDGKNAGNIRARAVIRG